MKNQTRIAEIALNNWHVAYAEYCDKFGHRLEVEADELDVVSTKSKGQDLFIFTNQTLSRHNVTELRGYCLDRTESDGRQYVKSDQKGYVIERALYPDGCYTRRELGHSISKSEWKNVTYKPVVHLENRLAYHAKNHAVYQYYRVARAIIKYSGQVTRILDGKEWTCAKISDDIYLVLSPDIFQINDELSESICPESASRTFNDGIELESDITALNKAEGKAHLMKTEKYQKQQQIKTVRRVHIRPNRTEKVPFEKCVVRS
jgi:hypothetical protein